MFHTLRSEYIVLVLLAVQPYSGVNEAVNSLHNGETPVCSSRPYLYTDAAVMAQAPPY